jgi:tRNA CCA-adding enzyme
MTFPFQELPGMKAAANVLSPATLEHIATIKARVLERIKPTGSEIDRVSSVTKRVSDAVLNILRGQAIAIDYIEPQGSTGLKQTQLAGDSDVDLFIGVNPAAIDAFKDSPKKEIKEKLKEIFTSTIKDALVPGLTKALNPQSLMFSYAEHPYLTIVVENVKFDVVFCLNLTCSYIEREDIVTAMDRTPLHSKFVKDNLTSEQKDEVRLLKAFFKAHYVYGDKAAPGPMGFIGYGVEILVHFFGNLENLMVNFGALPTTPVDVFGRNAAELRNVQRFVNDYLIIIDPTDRNRNVGSSTDERCYRHARHEIQAFLEHPGPEQFDMAPIPAPANDDPHLAAVVFNNEQQVHYTIVRDKLYRLGNLARKELENELSGEPRFGKMTFSVLLAKDESQAAIAFNVERPSIPATFRLLGPSQHDDKARVRAYLEKHPDARLDERGTYFMEKARSSTSFADALAKVTKSRLDIKGVASVKNARHAIDVSSNPESVIGRQAIHVLKHMILPYLTSE